MYKITAAPLKRIMAERNINELQLSQITGLSQQTVSQIRRGKAVTLENLDTLCRVLNCQPCDLIEFKKNGSFGHWEWVSD